MEQDCTFLTLCVKRTVMHLIRAFTERQPYHHPCPSSRRTEQEVVWLRRLEAAVEHAENSSQVGELNWCGSPSEEGSGASATV